jgi:hypothetical protein
MHVPIMVLKNTKKSYFFKKVFSGGRWYVQSLLFLRNTVIIFSVLCIQCRLSFVRHDGTVVVDVSTYVCFFLITSYLNGLEWLQSFAKVCKALQRFAKICKALQSFAKLWRRNSVGTYETFFLCRTVVSTYVRRIY